MGPSNLILDAVQVWEFDFLNYLKVPPHHCLNGNHRCSETGKKGFQQPCTTPFLRPMLNPLGFNTNAPP